MEYGCEGFNLASVTQKLKPNSIQYQAIRVVTGALPCTPHNVLQVECDEPPLQFRQKFLSQLYYDNKLSIHHNSHPNLSLQKDCWQKHYFAGKWGETDHHTPFEGKWNLVESI